MPPRATLPHPTQLTQTHNLSHTRLPSKTRANPNSPSTCLSDTRQTMSHQEFTPTLPKARKRTRAQNLRGLCDHTASTSRLPTTSLRIQPHLLTCLSARPRQPKSTFPSTFIISTAYASTYPSIYLVGQLEATLPKSGASARPPPAPSHPTPSPPTLRTVRERQRSPDKKRPDTGFHRYPLCSVVCVRRNEASPYEVVNRP